jgi:hypothetical protein
MIFWLCHSNSINTGSRLPSSSDVKTRKRRNVFGINMIRNNRIACHVHLLGTAPYFIIKNIILKRVFLFFFDSYLGNFKSRSTIFQNICWLVYKCSFIIWTLFLLIDMLLQYDFEVACFIFSISLTTSLVQWLARSPRVRYIVGSSRGRVEPMARKWYLLLLG